jgi:antitoxin (DNA-binding transcriptional repressor) of toxin-antitoxin stability system
VYNQVMAKHVIHLSEAEAAGAFGALLARVRAGVEIMIEDGARPVALLHAARQVRRTISEGIALLPENSTGHHRSRLCQGRGNSCKEPPRIAWPARMGVILVNPSLITALPSLTPDLPAC